jgi:hypothetical protein
MKRTVLILGAGASREVGLPVGDELKKHVASMLDIRFETDGRQRSGDWRIIDALRLHIHPARDVNPHRQAACRVAAAMPQAISIDNFIDAHKGDAKIEICGKLAIVQGILNAERASKLFHDSTSGEAFNHGRVAGTWFNGFFQVLTENCRLDNLEERLGALTLIVFNYDRCIEHYLYLAFQTYYGIGAERASELVKRIHIFHPYGSVGSLPWFRGNTSAAFGHEPNAQELLKLSGEIKTFTEGTDPSSSDIIAIREKVKAADRLVFLGFAFHPLNLQLLWDASAKPPAPSNTACFATGMGISTNDIGVIAAELVELGGFVEAKVRINTLTCSQLFQEYRRTLAM